MACGAYSARRSRTIQRYEENLAMTVYRRGDIWWYEFEFQSRRIRESSGFTNKTAALRAEAKRKADLIDRRAGFTQAKLAPKFEDYVVQFLRWSKQQHRPKTHSL